MIVVSNSGPIISFASANHLELLRQVLKEITIPEAVYEDIVLQGAKKPGAREVKSADWIKREAVKNRSKVEQLPSRLGLGEREAIVLAQELKAILLIDDRSARKEAEKRGIVCFGSLRVLKEAKDKGFFKEIKPLGDDLKKAGLRIKNSLYQKFIQEIGE
ncbi:MAG TPA: DUF3368 domain-containing protein [Candidatus Brocadiia bacterium]|nr:DUF3368 domain-containing protein [Candidatus Brocadiales bacterium]